MKYIDTHSHFNLSQFDTDRVEAIARMEAHNTSTICVGIDYESSVLAVELAQKYKSIWACVGQHPTEWCKKFDTELFRELLKKQRVVSIGECGLDYYRERERAEKEKQVTLFKQQTELAIETKLPLMLHIRPQAGTMDAYDDALTVLKEYELPSLEVTGTAHFFVGDERIAKEFLALGFYISFSGVITFAPEYEAVVKMVPLDRILSETDAPFAAPDPYRGTRAEPWQVQEVVKAIACIKNIPIEELETVLNKNAHDLFNLV